MACHESYFDRLSTELVVQVFEVLNYASPKSLLNVALACRRFHTHSDPIIHGCLVIPISPRAYRTVGELMKHLSTDSELCRAVREIIIPCGSKSSREASVEHHTRRSKKADEQWDRLTNVLPLLNRLNKIVYKAEVPIPRRLLHHLNNGRSDCRLYVHVPLITKDNKVLSRLQDSPSLFGLDVYVSMSNSLKDVCEVVSTCPNLRHLSIYTSRRPMGDAEMKVLRTAVESPRTLNSLKLQGFYDTIKGFPTHGVKQLKHADEDWSSLTRLSFSGLSLIPDLALQMVNLRSLQVNLGATNDPKIMRDPILNQFLYECRPLCELKLISYTETFDLGVLEHHGRVLRDLTLREDHRNLLMIGKSCPHLSTLGMDLRQQEKGDENSWPYVTLDTVAEHLWFIKHLDLYVEVGKTTPYKLAVTFSSVQHVWEYMWDKLQSLPLRLSGRSTQPELRSLNLHNDYTRPNFVSRIDGPEQVIRSYSETFRARLSERDDEASIGTVIVTNDKVEVLRWWMRQEEDFFSLEGKLKEALWRASVGAYEYARAWDEDDSPYR